MHSLLHVTCLFLAMLAACAADPIRTMLVIGDSISHHGPADKLGWAGTWGMAASAADKDWVHLLQTRIAANQGSPVAVRVDAEGGGRIAGKLQRLDALSAGNADLVIVQLGENENTPELEQGLEAGYEALVAAMRKAYPAARVLCFAVWTGGSGTSTKDQAIRRVCTRQGAEFISLAQANADRMNRAEADHRWTHPGVNWHPGDRGMQAYADAAWRVLQHLPEQDEAAPVSAVRPDGLVLAEDFADSAAVRTRWKGSGSGDDGGWCIAVDKPAIASLRTQLPAERLAGHQVRLSARIRSAATTPRPKPYNGIKVMLIITDAEGETLYQQLPTTDGTQAWTAVERTIPISATAVKTELLIGLEAVSGTVWFDDLRVEVLDAH
jgi:hypothetical protein